MDARIRDEIIRRLSNGVHADEIAFDLCEAYNLHWSDAEALVQQVEREEKHAIARRQFPLMLVIGAGLFIMGAVVLADAIITLKTSLQAVSIPGVEPVSKVGMLTTIVLAAPEIGIRLIVGTAIMAGSLAGISKALYPLIYKD